MKKVIAVAALAVAVATASVGCGVAQAVSQPGASGPAGTTGTLPGAAQGANDPYSAFRADDLLAINSAVTELDYRCFADNGYHEYLDILPTVKANSFRTTASTPDFKTTFSVLSKSPWFSSEEDARASGYGLSIPGLDPNVVVLDPSFTQVRSDCHNASLKKMSGSDEVISAYVQIGNNLASAISARSRGDKDTLTKKVFECMDKGRFPVDPNGPNKSHSWNVDFGVPLGTQPALPKPTDLTKGPQVKVVPAVPARPYVPTAQESDSAAAMYQCSVSTGAHGDWIKSMNDAKNAALAKNETALTELGPKIEALAKSAAVALQAKS